MACFTREDSDNIRSGLEVYMNARPPSSDSEDETSYDYFPLTGVLSGSMDAVASSTWSGDKYHFLWGNRWNGGTNPKANPLTPQIIHPTTGKQCRTEFSSITKAEAATKTQLLYSVGASQAEYEQAAIDGGISASDIYLHSTLDADPATYFTEDSTATTGGVSDYNVSIDLIPLSDGRIVNASGTNNGICLDMEFQDDRTSQELEDHVLDLASECHNAGFKFVIWTNPLNGSSQSATGLDKSNANTLFNAADGMSVLLFDGNTEGDIQESYENQLDILRGTSGTLEIDFDKLAIIFALGDSTFSQAQFARRLLETQVRRLWFWRAGASQGGVCDTDVNRKIACTSLGYGSIKPSSLLSV